MKIMSRKKKILEKRIRNREGNKVNRRFEDSLLSVSFKFLVVIGSPLSEMAEI